MVVVAARRDERSLVADSLLELEAEDAGPELERAIEVRDLEVHVPDVDSGIDRHGLRVPRGCSYPCLCLSAASSCCAFASESAPEQTFALSSFSIRSTCAARG